MPEEPPVLTAQLDAVITIDERGEIASVNPAAEQMFGYLQADIVGRNVRILMPDPDRRLHDSYLRRYRLSGDAHIIGRGREVVGRRKDGSTFPMQLGLSETRVAGRRLFTGVARDLSDQRRAERELTRFYSLSLDLMCTAGFDGYFKRLNLVWERTLGYTIEDLLAEPFVSFVHPEDVDATMSATERLSGGAELASFENRYRCKDGQYRWIQWSAASSVDDSLIYAVARDVTRERGTREALRQTTAFQHAILESANYSIISTDTEGTILTFNAAAERMYGYTAEEVIGQSTAMLHDPKDVVRRAAELSKELGVLVDPGFEVFVVKARAGAADEHEWTYVRKDGSRFPAMVSISALRDETGALIGFVGLAREITRRMQAEKAEARLLSILQTTTDMVGIFDTDGRNTFANRAWRRVMGVDVDADIDLSQHKFHPEWARRLIMDVGLPAATEHGVWVGETAVLTADGREVPVSEVVLAHKNAAGVVEYFSTASRDISAQKEVDRMKSDFVATVSHELRTPLTSIRGSIGLLEGGVAGEVSKEAHKLLGIARQNCDRLIRMINDILDLERIEAGGLDLRSERVDVASLVDRAVESLATMAEEAGVRLDRHLDRPGVVFGDPDRLMQVLTNLLANAVKFSPRESCVELHASRVDATVRIAIRDHGPGISDDLLPQLFGRFQQLDSSDARPKGGSGLGLAISKGIVDQHEGTITVETALGRGSTFLVTLPAAEEPELG